MSRSVAHAERRQHPDHPERRIAVRVAGGVLVAELEQVVAQLVRARRAGQAERGKHRQPQRPRAEEPARRPLGPGQERYGPGKRQQEEQLVGRLERAPGRIGPEEREKRPGHVGREQGQRHARPARRGKRPAHSDAHHEGHGRGEDCRRIPVAREVSATVGCQVEPQPEDRELRAGAAGRSAETQASGPARRPPGRPLPLYDLRRHHQDYDLNSSNRRFQPKESIYRNAGRRGGRIGRCRCGEMKRAKV